MLLHRLTNLKRKNVLQTPCISYKFSFHDFWRIIALVLINDFVGLSTENSPPDVHQNARIPLSFLFIMEETGPVRVSDLNAGVPNLFSHVTQLIKKQKFRGQPTVQLLQRDNCYISTEHIYKQRALQCMRNLGLFRVRKSG